MNVDEAIDVIISRRGRPYEDDWEAIEAAEVLAAEVVRLRRCLGKPGPQVTAKH